MFAPDENACELFRRLNNKTFDLKIDKKCVEKIEFGEIIEVLGLSSELPEFVLGAVLDFCSQFEDGIVIHLSTGNNLAISLTQSKFDVMNSPLAILGDRIKCITLQNISQLLAYVELFKLTLNGEKTLIIFEGLSPVILAQRSFNSTIQPTSLIHATLKSIQSLGQSQMIVGIWANSAVPKLSGGLREGSFKDPLTALWKQKFPKVYHYSFN